MDALRNASATLDFQVLVNRFYDIASVQGFAWGVHGNYVSMFRAEFGRSFSANDVLADPRTPTAWPEYCRLSGRSLTPSKLYVVIYTTLNEDAFRASYGPPDYINGDQAVIIETIQPYVGIADRGRHRPNIMGGVSVGNSRLGGAGTLGGFVQAGKQPDIYILSCAHVLFHSAGADIVQQGTADGGVAPGDVVGTTYCHVPLLAGTGFGFASPFNQADAALAAPNGAALPSLNIRLLGSVKSIVPLSSLGIGDDVVFVGKESDSQDCRISRYIARMKVDIQGTLYNFGNVFEIESRLPIYIGSLTRDGDSGAWVARYSSGCADELCGLLFAGNSSGPNKNKALACFMETVCLELKGRMKVDVTLP